MFSLLPAAFFLLGGVAMLWYRIDRKTLQRIETELHDRRHSSIDAASPAAAS